LPGVGESMADKIIEYRKDHNGFKKIEDLMKVKGIGKKKFANPARNKKIKNAKGLSANDTAVLNSCSRKLSISGLVYKDSLSR